MSGLRSGRVGKSMKPSPLSVELWKRLLGHLLSCWKTQARPVVGGVDCFPRPFESFAQIYNKFHHFYTEIESSDDWDPGNRVWASSEGLRRQKSVFLSSDFCFSPKSRFLNDFGTKNSIKTTTIFLQWRKKVKQKSCLLFSNISRGFFFSIANNSKTRGDRAILSKKLAV